MDDKLTVMSNAMFEQLLRLAPKEAAVVIALLAIRFYEEASDLGTPEEYAKNLADVITDELNIKL